MVSDVTLLFSRNDERVLPSSEKTGKEDISKSEFHIPV
jgi:hypothetical protein